MTFETSDSTKPPHHTTYNSTLPTTLAMGYRAYVGYVTQDGKVRAIYVHWANPESTIPVLLKHYHDFTKVKDLVNLGGCCRIDKEVFPREGASHSFDNPQDGVTKFYMRDRGDDPEGNAYKEYDSVANFSEARFDVFIEAMYLFKDNKWFYAATLEYNTNPGSNFDFRPADPTGFIGFVDSSGRLTYRICEKGIHDIYEMLLTRYDAPDKAKRLINDPSELEDEPNVQFDSKPCVRLDIKNVTALLEKFDQDSDFAPGAERRILFFDETTSQWFATAKIHKTLVHLDDEEDVDEDEDSLIFLPEELTKRNKQHMCIMPLRDLIRAFTSSTEKTLSDFDIFEHHDEFQYSEVHPNKCVVSIKGNQRKNEGFINDYREWAMEQYGLHSGNGNEFVFMRPMRIVNEEAEEFKKWQQAHINPRKRKSRDEHPKREV